MFVLKFWNITAVPVRRHVDPDHRGRHARDDETARQPADDAQLRRVPELSGERALAAPRAARQAGCRQGNPGGRASPTTTASCTCPPARSSARQAALGTAFGLEAKRYMDSGELVPDEIVVGVIEECLAPGGPLDRRLRARRFPAHAVPGPGARPRARRPAARPRDQPRRAARDRARPPGRPARLRELPARVPREHAADRRTGRATRAAGTVVQRDDDTEEAIDRRLELYEQETVPIIEYYRSQGMLAEVDGVGDGDDVFERLVKAVERALPERHR